MISVHTYMRMKSAVNLYAFRIDVHGCVEVRVSCYDGHTRSSIDIPALVLLGPTDRGHGQRNSKRSAAAGDGGLPFISQTPWCRSITLAGGYDA